MSSPLPTPGDNSFWCNAQPPEVLITPSFPVSIASHREANIRWSYQQQRNTQLEYYVMPGRSTSFSGCWSTLWCMGYFSSVRDKLTLSLFSAPPISHLMFPLFRTDDCDAPVAETGFSHRLTAYKIVGYFFGLSYIGKYRGVIRSKIVCFRIRNISVPCPHALLRGRSVIEKLWTFFGHWGRDRS